MAEGVEIDMRDISAAVRTITDELGIPVRDVVNKIGLDLWSDATEIAPVDTGRYRQAWNLNENTPDLNTPNPGLYGPPAPPSLATELYPVLYLTNALPYAVRIEEGWSTEKAPDGVLKVALAGRGFL